MYLGSDFTPRLDYAGMKILKHIAGDNGQDNYLSITKRKMTVILNNYKTHGKYGKIKFQLPLSMVKELKRLKVEDQEFLFPSNKGGHIRKNKFSEFIKGAMGVTVNDIRIMKESDIQSRPEYHSMSQRERNKLHIQLFQHLNAAQFYRKLDLLNLEDKPVDDEESLKVIVKE